jgi:hypothetical protein
VWLIQIPQFSAQNLKHRLDSELGALEVVFGPLPVGKPRVGFGWMRNLILPNFKIFLPDFEFGSQSYGRFTEPHPSSGF